MRHRIFVLCALCVCLLLSGCPGKTVLEQQPEVLKQLSRSFAATAGIRYGELAASALITRDSPKSCTVAFSSPDSLLNMSFIFLQDTVELHYRGLAFRFDSALMPGRAVAKTAVAAINAAIGGSGVRASRQGNELLVEGTIENGAFILCLDAQTGNLLKLSVPGEELEIEFSDFRFFS